MASVHPPQPSSSIPIQARRPSLRHRLSNNARSPPVPPSLVDSPYLQSPNSPFKRKSGAPSASSSVPSHDEFHDSLGLYDTVPMGAPPSDYLEHRRNSVGFTSGPPGASQRYSQAGGASVSGGQASLRSGGMTQGLVPSSLTPSSSSSSMSSSQPRSSAALVPGAIVSRPASFTNQPLSSSTSRSTSLPHQASYPHHHNLPPASSQSQATQQSTRR